MSDIDSLLKLADELKDVIRLADDIDKHITVDVIDAIKEIDEDRVAYVLVAFTSVCSSAVSYKQRVTTLMNHLSDAEHDISVLVDVRDREIQDVCGAAQVLQKDFHSKCDKFKADCRRWFPYFDWDEACDDRSYFWDVKHNIETAEYKVDKLAEIVLDVVGNTCYDTINSILNQ